MGFQDIFGTTKPLYWCVCGDCDFDPAQLCRVARTEEVSAEFRLPITAISITSVEVEVENEGEPR